MNMKRFAFALLAALLLCLLAESALADIIVTHEGEPPVYYNSGEITISKNATVEGSATDVATDVYLVVDASVTELTLRDVSITSSNASALTFNGSAGNTLTLTLEGYNKLESSNGNGIHTPYYNSTLIITGSGTLEAIGADKIGEREEGGRGIFFKGTLKITSTGSVTATGGAGTGNFGWGGTGIRANKLEISGTGSVTATGGKGETFGGMGMDIETDDGLSIANGSTVTVTAGEGSNRGPALQTFGNIFVDSSTLTVNALRSDGIYFLVPVRNGSAGKLIVSGDSHVTVNSGSGAATSAPEFMSDVDDYIPAQIELNGAFVMRAGDNKDSATEIHAYDQKYPYLSIEPATPIAPGSINVPRTGDDANLLLWSALACISLIGMMTLVRKRKEA